MFKLSEVALINPIVSFSKLSLDEEISFVPMEAINENNGSIDYLYKKNVKETKGFTKFSENDLLWAKITPCMQNGKSAVAKNLINGFGCGSTEFYVIRPKTDELLIEYLHVLLRDERVLESAKNFFGGSAGQQRVSKQFLLNMLIPIPPKEYQIKIIKIMNDAYTIKKHKEKEANRLLLSINDYLLDELGIAIPYIEENTLENRISYVASTDVIGNRYDPFYYKNTFIENLENIKNGRYKCQPLITYTKEGLIKGKLPNDEQKSGNCKVIQINCMNMDGTINTSNVLTSKEIFSINQLINKGDVLIVITGATIGKIGYWDYDGEYYLGGDIIKFNTGNEYYNIILSSLLQSAPYQLLIKRCITGATNGHLSPNDVSKFPIPIIDNNDKQKEIANYIQKIRVKALQLSEKATCEINEAKKNIEKILLGENIDED